jgi:hypothetical protein
MRARLAVLCLAPLALAGCSSGNCDLFDPTSCDPGLVCDPVINDPNPHCFPPVEVVGTVVDATNGRGIATAEVTAFDNLGAPASVLTFSGKDGTFTLRIPSFREDTKGTPHAFPMMLFANAKDHLPYGAGVQNAPLIDTGLAVEKSPGLPWELTVPQTTLRLLPAPAALQNQFLINGAAQITQGELGILVTAESNGKAVSATFADGLGNFTLFNVPPGSYAIQAYASGLNYVGVSLNVVNSSIDGVGIGISTVGPATMNGNVAVPPGDGGTSVNLFLESTYDPNLGRGLSPFGLRAPAMGSPPNISGTFSIAGVPDGRWAVVPGVENDGWVRAPGDAGVGHLVVTNSSPDSSPSLAVVGAVQLVSPGGGDAVDSASATPTFIWTAYPGATSYSLVLADSFGNPIAYNPTLGAGDTQVTYDGPALVTGALYQWHLTALDGSGAPISQSEDLKGLFTVQ